MRKRNHTVTIRMNEKEYGLLQQKIKASGQTQQAVILAAIENVDLMSAEVKEELNVLRGATTNINQIAHHMNAGGFYPRADVLNSLSENISGYRKECETIWRSIRQLISGQIPMGQ